jgi:hypothetical protein
MSNCVDLARGILAFLCKTIVALAALSLLPSCGSIERIDSAGTGASFGTIEDGRVTRQELTGRLGEPYRTFEGRRIAIYQLDDSNGGFDESFDADAAPYRLVLVFDSNDVLVKHSVVRVK